MRALWFVVLAACGSAKQAEPAAAPGSASSVAPPPADAAVAVVVDAIVDEEAELAAIDREMAELEKEQDEAYAEREAATTDDQKRVAAEKQLDVLRRMKVVMGRKIAIMKNRATKGEPANDSPCVDNPLAKGCM